MKVTVMLGGPSAERAVSLQSGAAVAAALRGLGHDVEELDPRTDDWRLADGVEVVFLALHGTYGEDGTVQARLEALGVPYTGSGVKASRLAFDKALTKERLVQARIPTPRSVVLSVATKQWPEGWKPPVVLKPVTQGSSVGLQFVHREEGWPGAVQEAFGHGVPVLMEERILGRETTAGFLGDAALPLVEVRPKGGVYDFASKYTSGATEYFCPAPLEPAVTERVQDAARSAFSSLGCRDYGRVDVMVNERGEPFVLEVNTLPGMTETSLLPKAALAAGIGYPQLCQRMIDLALARGGTDGDGGKEKN